MKAIVGRRLFAAAAGLAAAAALALVPAGAAHPDKRFCEDAVTTQHRTFVGDAKRIYRAPHGCVWLERFDPAKPRATPYKIFVRVHAQRRALQAPLPTDLLHPEHAGFCGPHDFAVHWPYVIHAAAQRIPAGAGRFVCAERILWMAQIDQYATRASWRVYKAPE